MFARAFDPHANNNNPRKGKALHKCHIHIKHFLSVNHRATEIFKPNHLYRENSFQPGNSIITASKPMPFNGDFIGKTKFRPHPIIASEIKHNRGLDIH